MARILVIDDEPAFCDLCAQVLREIGHAVTTSLDGNDGLAAFRAEPSDVVIVDLHMPHSGLQVVRVLRELHPRVPLIAMTGHGRWRLDLAGGLGADFLLDKPFTAEALKNIVTSALPAKAK